MNESMPTPALLENAAKLIERALTQLNPRRYDCLECGRPAYVDEIDGKANERLANLPNKLRQVATRLRDRRWHDMDDEG